MTTFDQLGIDPRLLKAIGELGFENPMPIQEMVIPHLLEKEGDVVGLAQTGTGKTAAFGLPLLQRIDASRCDTQALVIAPTRELCLQIAGDLADFSKYLDGVRIIPVYGGSSIESQIKGIRKGVQVIVATPGRLIDLIKRGVVKLDHVNTVVLDEADEMLNMGFIDDINEILSHVPEQRKMLMFSATMPKEIAAISRKFMHDPVEFVAGNKNEGSSNVKHIYYMVKAHDKYLALKRVADNNPDIYGIIFCRTKKETQEIADNLIADGYNADCLHGDLSQAQRDLAMKKFRDHVTQLLVATDVAARGLDVDDLTHVINYGLPDDTAVYTHRSGRTGRANKTGVSVAIIHSRERGKLREIEKMIGKTFEYRKVPTPEHIIEKQIYNLADRLERVEVNEENISRYLPGVRKKLEWLSEEDLLKSARWNSTDCSNTTATCPTSTSMPPTARRKGTARGVTARGTRTWRQGPSHGAGRLRAPYGQYRQGRRILPGQLDGTRQPQCDRLQAGDRTHRPAPGIHTLRCQEKGCAQSGRRFAQRRFLRPESEGRVCHRPRLRTRG